MTLAPKVSRDEEDWLIDRIMAIYDPVPASDGARRRVARLTRELRAMQRAAGHWRSYALTLYTGGAV